MSQNATAERQEASTPLNTRDASSNTREKIPSRTRRYSSSKSPVVSRARKMSEPIKRPQNETAATATLEETLNGLQKVSDMLQASLKDLDVKNLSSSTLAPPEPPPR